MEARRQVDREPDDLLDALDRQGDRRLPPVRRLDPENRLNTLDPAYFEPPPAITGRYDPTLPGTTVEEPTPRTTERSTAGSAAPDGLPS